MSQREEGKLKSLRIDLQYHRHRSWLDICRLLAALSGLVLVTAYGVWILARNDGRLDDARTAHLSTGPLALVHANFENDCQKCHSNELGVALSRDAWQMDRQPRLALQEQKCKVCHDIDHHFQLTLSNPAVDQDCSGCHQDHSGRTLSLVAQSNLACTQCHANLGDACKAGHDSQLNRSIDQFSSLTHGVQLASTSSDSPALQFRSLLKDRGRVKFDHAQHLRPGQVDEGSKGGFQLSMLSPALRTRYMHENQSEDALVQLNCNSCHQPHAISEPGLLSSTAREEGRYYAPVDFERHCAACHQITFAGQDLNHLPLPHVAQPEEYAQLLRSKLVVGGLQGKITMPGDAAADVPDRQNLAPSNKPIELAQVKVEAGVTAIFLRCTQCHLKEDLSREAIGRSLAGTLPSLIPQRWLQRGYFDHASHSRIQRCDFCHRIPSAAGPATDNQHVFIRGPESCTPCHRDAAAPEPAEFESQASRIELIGNAQQPTWASASCVLCHRYHWTRDVGTRGATNATSQ